MPMRCVFKSFHTEECSKRLRLRLAFSLNMCGCMVSLNVTKCSWIQMNPDTCGLGPKTSLKMLTKNGKIKYENAKSLIMKCKI